MGSSASVAVGRYAYGVLALAVVVGSLAFAAVRLRRRYWPALDGASARLAEVVLGLGLLTLILEALGLVGWFRLLPVVGACVAAAIAATRIASPTPPHAANQAALPMLTMLLAAAAVIAEWAEPTVHSYRVGIFGFDSLWYHLPLAATFAQTGHVAPLHFTDVEYLTAFYPATGELFHGLGIVLLGRDTLSPGLNLMWLGLVLLAAYCIGRPRGLGALTATGAALAMALPMFSASQGGSAANDVVGVFFLLAAVALLDAPLLAGAAAGLAVSVKLTLIAPVAALLLFRGRRQMVLPLVLTGGFWYVRNLIAVGNPLPWFGPLPRPAPPLQKNTGFTVWHYLLHPHLFESGLRSGLGPWWPAVLAAVIIGPVACLRDRSLRPLGLVALAATVAYLLTPEAAAGPRGDPIGFAFNLRYAAPALALSLTLLPLAIRRARPVLLLILAATLLQSRLWPSSALIGAIAIAVAGLAIAWRPRLALIAIPAVLVAGYPIQSHYLRGRYAFHPHVSYLARAWALFRGIHHAHIGVVGAFGGFFSYPFYGLDDSNRVQYIAHRGPHGSFTPIGSCSAWRAAVDDGHFRYLVTTPARDPWHPSRLGPAPEGVWTASSQAARIVYRLVALGQPITVFKLSGALGSTGCPAHAA